MSNGTCTCSGKYYIWVIKLLLGIDCCVVGCYGISEAQSAASTESSASTEPWFCDACKAGVMPVRRISLITYVL